ncbi:Acetyltransferase gnat family [Vibrio nigripulchritudo SOn1]|uniref:Acetyltransferase gnat family n=1 Tax=Vibrio nigripulchritudo SOn1 TaxID=1238450 RepID=A0AAV2W064_9VIBR|nr:GNAT family N-acetyltransferase [Vibrio nigripulchritudo]CCO50208.1 Acetyltransferase gnat family [Vibrio nigripulchritudo SOn1]
MEIKQLNTNQLRQLISSVSIGVEMDFCVGSIPPMHVLNRSVQHTKSGKNEMWALPYMMLFHNHVVGFCGFKGEPIAGEVEIGYNVAEKQQGRGLAKSAVNKLCKVAFNSGLVENIVALISSTNVASLNVVKANNFVFTGKVVDDDNEKLEKWVLNLNKASFA